MLAGGGWLSPRDNRDWDTYSRVAERPARTASPEPLAALGSPTFPDFALPFCPLGSPPSLPLCYRLRLPGAHLLSRGPAAGHFISMGALAPWEWLSGQMDESGGATGHRM